MKTLKHIYIKISFLISCLFLFGSCVEELELNSENFESILVVEGIITDKNQIQKIKLSRSYRLEDDGPLAVRNAAVSISASNENIYNFSETSEGLYESDIPFSAQPNITYILKIATSNGSYESSAVAGQKKTFIDNIKSTKAKVNEEVGVAILINSSDESTGGYYKYEFEETYKIVSPYEILRDLIINEEGEIEVVPKTNEEYICYNTESSKEIILSSTTELSENDINDHLVRFLSKENPKLGYRYSILLKQLKIDAEAHSFYTTLKNLSGNKNIFSQYQPGFLNGNISSIIGSGEKVIGFFTTASIDEERLFFNYTDFFDPIEDPRPSHYGPCDRFVPEPDHLRELLLDNSVVFFGEDPPGVYSVITPRCVDCNYFGTNVPPDFWIE